jgi:hypothetical protein
MDEQRLNRKLLAALNEHLRDMERRVERLEEWLLINTSKADADFDWNKKAVTELLKERRSREKRRK